VSTSQKPAQPRCAVTITKQEIIADDRVLANVVDVEKSDSLVIAPLFTTMQAMRPVCLADSVGSIIILCDKDVNFAVVKKVMASCSRAGITDFSILVLREGE
jgi:biopolymer transport protein ExbD